jgi:AbrB family looped-hinge helix DNA binding protein
MTRKGQITVPVEVREKLGLEEGSEVEFEVEGDCVKIRKIPSVFDLAGSWVGKTTYEETMRLLEKLRAQDG